MLEKASEKLENSSMSDTEYAASLLDELIGSRGVREPIKSMLERAYSALSGRNKAWTRRRVRAVFYKEATRVDHREIEELRELVVARKAHAAYRQETARIASMAFVQPPSPDCNLVP